MNLLFVLPEYYPHPGGGIATYYLELLPELVRQGHQVKVLVGSGVTNGTEVLIKEGVAIEYLKPGNFSNYLQKFTKFSVFPELQKHLAAAWGMWEQASGGEGFDIVETTDWGLGYSPWLISPDSPPVIITLHASIGQIEYYEPRLGYEMHGDLMRMIESNLLEAAQVLITYSKSNQAEWQHLISHTVSYIPPAYSSGSKRNSLSSDRQIRVVGRVQHWKGPETLCRALQILGEGFPGIEWIGRDTEFKGKIKSTSGYLQRQYPQVWQKQIKAIGALPYAEVQNRMAQARFGIVPSVWDVFNYTCAEWMNCAKTVICSTGAGAADLIDHGRNGFVFPKEDYQALAELLEEVHTLSDEALHRIGNHARETVAINLNPAQVAEARAKLYAIIHQQAPLKKLSPWLKAALSPSNTVDNIPETLNHLPLKVLSKYTLNRTILKLTSHG